MAIAVTNPSSVQDPGSNWQPVRELQRGFMDLTATRKGRTQAEAKMPEGFI